MSALASSLGPILTIGLMGTGMIAASATGRLRVGLGLAIGVGTALLALAQLLGSPVLPNLLALAIAILIASVSFAVRGALFAASQPGRGWVIALFVVAGEAAIILTALAQPGALPDWLLALLPAQWTSMAIQSAVSGAGVFAAWPALVALAGTAAATQLVAQLWPARWTYLIMFSTWLSLSALVYYQY